MAAVSLRLDQAAGDGRRGAWSCARASRSREPGGCRAGPVRRRCRRLRGGLAAPKLARGFGASGGGRRRAQDVPLGHARPARGHALELHVVLVRHVASRRGGADVGRAGLGRSRWSGLAVCGGVAAAPVRSARRRRPSSTASTSPTLTSAPARRGDGCSTPARIGADLQVDLLGLELHERHRRPPRPSPGCFSQLRHAGLDDRLAQFGHDDVRAYARLPTPVVDRTRSGSASGPAPVEAPGRRCAAGWPRARRRSPRRGSNCGRPADVPQRPPPVDELLERAGRTNSQAPMFSGSSCTQHTRRSFG